MYDHSLPLNRFLDSEDRRIIGINKIMRTRGDDNYYYIGLAFVFTKMLVGIFLENNYFYVKLWQCDTIYTTINYTSQKNLK